MRKPLYLQRGNDKLGRSVRTWSMPAVSGCGPAPSEYCVQRCYAIAFRRYPGVMRAHGRNLLLAQDARALEEALRTDLGCLPAGSVVRIHVAGDFFSKEYARAWRRVAREFDSLTIYAYTRAWTDRAIRRELDRMRALPNVRLWASSDSTMSVPPGDWLEARVFPAIAEAEDAGFVVCPEQLGRRASCEECQLCWRIPPDSGFRLAFIDHVQLQRAGEGKYSSSSSAT